MMIDKIQRQQKCVLKLADAVRTGTVGKPDGSKVENEDMAVSIGNEIHYHLPPEAVKPVPDSPVIPLSPTTPLVKHVLWPWLLASVIVTTILVGGATYYFTRLTVDSDTDTRSTLRPYTGPEPK